MKITFEELMNRSEYMHIELLNSLTNEIIEKARSNGEFEVNMLVNGVKLEPRWFNDLMANIETYIYNEARMIADEKNERLITVN